MPHKHHKKPSHVTILQTFHQKQTKQNRFLYTYFTTFFLLSLLQEVCGDKISSLFSAENTHYRLDTDSRYNFSSVHNAISQKLCDVMKGNTSLEEYNLIDDWYDSGRGGTALIAEFLRGAEDTTIESVETCIKGLISQVVDAYNPQVDPLEIFIFVGAVFGFIALTLFIVAVVLAINIHCNSSAGNSPADIEGGMQSEDILLQDIRYLFEDANSVKAIPTFAERLMKIGYDVDQCPRDFICPITQDIIENPTIADDGNSYERTEIEKMKANEKYCPLNPVIQVNTLIPNNRLR